MNTHYVTTVFKGGMAFDATLNNHLVKLDSVPADGGTDGGASPKRLMLAALAGCTGMDIVPILNKMKVAFSDFSIAIEARLTAKHPKTYNWVKITYTIKLATTSRHNMEKAVNLSQDKYCGVSAMFKEFAALETEIVYL